MRRASISSSRCAATLRSRRAQYGSASRCECIGGSTIRRWKAAKLRDGKRFFRAYNELTTRISLFLSLPMEKLDRLALQKRLDDIGKAGTEAPAA
jgi:hypothetical protein